jgi:sortase A
MRILLLWLGLGCLGYCAYVTGIEHLNQSYDNWLFEQHIAGRQDTSVADFLRERSPLGLLVKDDDASSSPTATAQSAPPQQDAILGKIEIGRLNLSAMVREGVDARTLSTAVGHVPSTALPGHAGNFALAAHRDTLFRALKDIKLDDLITFQSQNQTFTYRVHDTHIVKPSDVSVLRSDGHEALTLITCYPFYYVGSAPKRFIVHAQLVSETPSTEKIALSSPLAR